MAEQLVCWFIGLLLIVAAFRYLVKEKLTFSFLLCLFAVAFFFFGLSGVQGLLKTGLLLTVKDSLVQYGEKLERFQQNVASMKTDLSDQQEELRKAQHALSITQTNLVLQHKKLENVEAIVNSLYSRMMFERVPFSDTNRIWKKEITNGVWIVFCRLKHSPVPQSIQANLLGDLFPHPLSYPVSHHKNILFEQLGDAWLREAEGAFSVQYVIDSSETNLVHDVAFKGEDILFNGQRFPWKPKAE